MVIAISRHQRAAALLLLALSAAAGAVDSDHGGDIMPRSFAQTDVNGDQRVDPGEARRAGLGWLVWEWEEADLNGDHLLDRAEFASYIAANIDHTWSIDEDEVRPAPDPPR